MAEAFPLHWPEGWPRTTAPRQRSRFDVSSGQARDGLLAEISRLGGKYVVLSTDIELRRDGLPYANQRVTDPGVAVYFERKGKQMVFACDRWDSVKDNMRAIQKTIEAMRGIERWGASDMLERAFSAFEALPAPGATTRRSWREVLGFPPAAHPDREGIEFAYRSKAKRAHPDAGGSTEAFTELQQARDEALRATGGA